ncbi:amine dehydrogenase large subunit [Govanella unica]|uniref:Amine dehydrogenase n=1 Tax=Govanella unica TaxID=2975056 RepID=A0A9X3U0E8_9PROT|nr:amine dehydrogenase large subunit [Govania unica]MDA5195055.1 amine dehydrogenase [Govania unica]
MISLCGTAAGAADFPEPLAVEQTPNVLTLPAKYPKNWVFLHDFYFPSIIDGRVALVDVTADTRNLKGQIPAAQFANFLPATSRPELYVAETAYSRVTRGERTDVITIYDTATLGIKGEIILPGGKRALNVTLKNNFQFTDGERLGLVFNFTPAASVTVVDLEQRKILNEVETPGCSLAYPTGKRGFSMLCANGTLASFKLDAAGKMIAQSESKPFNNLDHDPMFAMPAHVQGVAYFPTFLGHVQPIDFHGEDAKILKPWDLVTAAEAKSGWRPSGWQNVSGDDGGRLYVLMQPDGKNGSHKEGGTEVWVYDVAKKARVQRIVLKNPGLSIEVTKGPQPLLVVISPVGSIDVYQSDGKLQRSLGGKIVDTAMVMHAVQ